MSDNRLTLMAVHAHPDDEIFLTGGVLAKAAAEGIHTVLVTATRGEEGEIHDPALDPEEAKGRLGEIREGELREAARILGVAELHILGFRDSGMAGTPANEHPYNFHNADLEETTRRLVRIIRQTRPDVIVTYDERGGYGHPDHIAAHRATVAAFDAAGDAERFPDTDHPAWQPRKLYYGVFSRSAYDRMVEVFREHGIGEEPEEGSDEDPASYSVPDADVTTWVDVYQYAHLKRAALEVHRTQIPAGSPFFTLSKEMGRELGGRESFVLIRSTTPISIPENDLFTGLRAASPAASGG